MRDAVNYALTANPGGVKAKVQNPSGITVFQEYAIGHNEI